MADALNRCKPELSHMQRVYGQRLGVNLPDTQVEAVIGYPKVIGSQMVFLWNTTFALRFCVTQSERRINQYLGVSY